MSIKKLLLAAVLAVVSTGLTGCQTTFGPQTGLWLYPIPVSPFFQKQLEDRFRNKERYERVAILGPITSGGPPQALDPPSEAEIMAALPSVEGGLPFLDEVQRNNVRMTVELIADYVDPPRFYPIIGWAQLHHAHYKCTVYYTEITRVGWPLPHTTVDEDHSEVIYIDHNHFHIVGNVDGGANTPYAPPPQ
jgi:hypothetical protein